jgi:hypothetical protein
MKPQTADNFPSLQLPHCWVIQHRSSAADEEIILNKPVPLTGSGCLVSSSSQICFDQVNAVGGVNKRNIELRNAGRRL